jgi:hypothetical protein
VADGRSDRRDLEPRDTRGYQNRSGGVPRGVGDEYADGDRQPPLSNSRLTGVRQAPTDAAIVRTRDGGPVLPRGEAGAAIGPPVTTPQVPLT